MHLWMDTTAIYMVHKQNAVLLFINNLKKILFVLQGDISLRCWSNASLTPNYRKKEESNMKARLICNVCYPDETPQPVHNI